MDLAHFLQNPQLLDQGEAELEKLAQSAVDLTREAAMAPVHPAEPARHPAPKARPQSVRPMPRIRLAPT